MVPDEKSDQLFSLFLQDDLAFFNDRLHLIVGSKLEHNDSTGWEVQPSARLLWAPNPRHTLWAAVSRAVRSPSRSEHDLQAVSGVTVSGSPPTATIRMVMGDNDFVSEELLAYELGYRTQPHQRLSLDLALFYNDYRRLRTLVTGTPIAAGPGTTILPLEFSNRMQGETYGLEAVANIQLRNWWRLAAGYTWFNIALHAAEDVIEATGEGTEGNDPEHQYSLRSTMNLPGNLALDTALYYYDSLHSGDVPAYYRLDVRLGWCPWQTVEVSLKVENLLDDKHPEFKESIFFTRPGQVPRSVYGEISWRF
jgi:iron complex outermembrane receptor protein